MVGCEQFVCDGIFSHKSVKSSIVEMSDIIADFGSRGSEAKKMFSFKNFMTTLLSLVLLGMASTHLDA